MPTKQWIISLFVAFGLLTGCDGTEAEEPRDAEVRIPVGTGVPGCEDTNACYLPATVTINVGAKVTWSNDDTSAHTVTSGAPEGGPSGLFDSSLFLSGSTFEHAFDKAGTFPYFCMVHPWQKGTVTVEE